MSLEASTITNHPNSHSSEAAILFSTFSLPWDTDFYMVLMISAYFVLFFLFSHNIIINLLFFQD